MENTQQVLSELGIEFQSSKDTPLAGGENQFNPGELTPEFFGEGFSSWDQVKEIPEKLKKMSQIEQEMEQLRNRPETDFADEEIGMFNNFVKSTGKKDWNLFNSVSKKDTLGEDVDALVFKAVYDNPDLIGMEDKLRDKFLKDFKQDPQLFDETEIKLNQPDFKAKVKEVNDWFATLKTSFKGPEKESPEQRQQRIADHQAKIKEIVNGTAAQVTKLPIPIYNSDKKAIETLGEFEIKDDIKNALAERLATFLASASPENAAKIAKEAFTEGFIINNLPHIVSHALSIREAQLREELEAQYGQGITRPRPAGGTGGDGDDILDRILPK